MYTYYTIRCRRVLAWARDALVLRFHAEELGEGRLGNSKY